MSLLPSSTSGIDTEQAGDIQIPGIDEHDTDAVLLLKQFLGASSAFALLSLIVHTPVEGFPFVAHSAVGGQPESTGWPTGVAFFVGGFVILLLVFWWQASHQ